MMTQYTTVTRNFGTPKKGDRTSFKPETGATNYKNRFQLPTTTRVIAASYAKIPYIKLAEKAKLISADMDLFLEAK